MSTLAQNDVMQLAAEGRAEELWHDLRRRALTSLYYFAKVVCSYPAIVPGFHMPLCNDLQNTIAIRKRGYLWPRGHFKSTIIAKSYPHWRLLGGGQLETLPELLSLTTPQLVAFYKTYPERDPRNLRIAIAGESQEVANKDLKDIKDRTLNSEIFRWLFPEIVPEDTNKVKWSESEILLPRTNSYDESSITCMGVGAKRTGFHYDILVYDDIIGLESSKSPAVMEEALNWMQFAPGLLNDPETGEELIAGTRWKDGTADVYGWLMKYLPYKPATTTSAPTGFKFSTMSCFHEPTREPRFPERFTQETLADIEKREGPYKFNCNYRNTPTPPDGAKLGKFKFYEIVQDRDGNMAVARFEDGTPDVHINQLARNSFYDPSAGGLKADCENAIAVIGTDELRRHLVIDVWSMNTGYSGAIEKWHELNDKYRCWKNSYEQVGHQKEVAEIVLMRTLYGTKCPFCDKSHAKLIPTGSKPPQGLNKYERIELFLEPVIADGRFYIQRRHVELARQLTMFPNGDLVDQADAAAWGVHEAIPPQGMDSMMDERTASRVNAMNQSRTNTARNYGGYQ